MISPQSFYIVRHGERLDFIDPNYKSDRPHDPPLSKNGFEQAKRLGKWLLDEDFKIHTILCSPFERCVQTATEVAEFYDLGIKIENGLHEWYGSVLEANETHLPKTATELKKTYGRIDDSYMSKFNVRLGLEDEVELHKRFHNVAKYINSEFYRDKSLGNVLVVSHAACVIALTRAMMSLDVDESELDGYYQPKSKGRIPVNKSGVCSFTWLETSCPNEWSLKVSGQKDHLSGFDLYEWGFLVDE